MKEETKSNLKITAFIFIFVIAFLIPLGVFLKKHDDNKVFKKVRIRYVCTDQWVQYIQSNTGSLYVSLDQDGKPVKCDQGD